MDGVLIAYIVSVIVNTILILIFVLTLQWFLFALKLLHKKFFTKWDIGLIFIQSASKNFGFPYVVDFNQKTCKIKNKEYPIDSSLIGHGKFFSYPYIMFPYDDAKTSIGLYYQSTDKEGKGEIEELKKGGKIKKLIEVSPSVTLPPDLFRGIIGTKALSMAIVELFQKHKTQIYILAGIGIGIGISLYLSYNMYSEKIPELFNVCTEAKNFIINSECFVNATTPIKELPLP